MAKLIASLAEARGGSKTRCRTSTAARLGRCTAGWAAFGCQLPQPARHPGLAELAGVQDSLVKPCAAAGMALDHSAVMERGTGLFDAA